MSKIPISKALESTAPHIHATGSPPMLELWRDRSGAAFAGVVELEPGESRRPLDLMSRHEGWNGDAVAHVAAGRAVCRDGDGEGEGGSLSVARHTLIHFRRGWRGLLVVEETLRLIYLCCAADEAVTEVGGLPAVLHDTLGASPLTDWGEIDTMVHGRSTTAGILLGKRSAQSRSGPAESGIWTCTPGTWDCTVTSDELCHFLAGHCRYTHESGEQIEIAPDTVALFPAGWRGRCEVSETIRKAYVIR